MSNSEVRSPWLVSKRASHFLAVEKDYTDRALRQISGPSILLLGNLIAHEILQELDYPQLVRTSPRGVCDQKSYSLAADSAFLPFENRSFATVVVPHILESHDLPHQVLREVNRVLQPEGHLVLTCFNPLSCIGLQRLFRQKAVPAGQYYSLARVKDWLHLLGFEVVGSAMYHYAPLSNSDLITRRLNFINALGDRWLPMLGGSYLITARKRELGMRLVGRKRFGNARRGSGLEPASAASMSTIKEKKSNN